MNQFRNPRTYAEFCHRCGATLRDIVVDSRNNPHVPSSFWLDAMLELLRLDVETSAHTERRSA